MITNEKDKIIENCDTMTQYKRVKSIDNFMSAINLIFFQKLFEGKEDLNLLRSLYDAKAKVLETKPDCILNCRAQFIISRILTCVDEMDTSKKWDHESNKFWFKEMRQSMSMLRQYYPIW